MTAPIEYLGSLRCPVCGGPAVTGEGFLRCALCGWTMPLAGLMRGLRRAYPTQPAKPTFSICEVCGRKKKTKVGAMCQHCRANRAARDSSGNYTIVEEAGEITPEVWEILRERPESHPRPTL